MFLNITRQASVSSNEGQTIEHDFSVAKESKKNILLKP